MTEIGTEIVRRALYAYRPPPRNTVSQWADENRMLSAEASAEPGRWKTSRAEYQRGIMDAFSDPNVETVVVMSSAQVGKTEFLLNIIGYFIDQDPAPMLVMQPTQKPMAEAFSKDRLAPMIRDTPALQGKVKDARSRDSGNTLLHKTFPGGHITLVGANAPSGLASRPIRAVLCDEVDRYPASAGTEGDPVSLAFKRTTTFWNRKHALVSTPGLKHASRIEQAFEASDKRHYYVPCPECSHEQILTFSNVKWESKKHHTARYCCEKCGSLWNDSQRWDAVSKGKWEASEEFNGTAGFHINALYSPWVKLSSVVSEYEDAQEDTELLITFTNTVLGETYELKGEQADEHQLMKRREDYKGVPDHAILLTAGIDTQDDRLEMEVVGWGIGEESWSIAYVVIHGSPGNDSTWDDLETALNADYDGMRIAGAMLDTGGHFTQKAYEFAKKHAGKRWWAIKGSSVPGAPLIGRPSKSNKGNVKLFPIGTDAAKEIILHRLRISEHGPGYMHFSEYVNDEEYFKQLTAEKLVSKKRKGVPYREWVKTRERNEALDCRVYAYAAMKNLNPNWKALSEESKDESEKKPRIRVKKRESKPSSWVRR